MVCTRNKVLNTNWEKINLKDKLFELVVNILFIFLSPLKVKQGWVLLKFILLTLWTTSYFHDTCQESSALNLPMKRMFPNTLRLIVDRCSSSSGVSGPSFLSKATIQKALRCNINIVNQKLRTLPTTQNKQPTDIS